MPRGSAPSTCSPATIILLFLLGVMLFLTRFSQIVVFITAFTAGHTITLLFATLAGITANPYLVDAVIALTVTYKAFENLDLFRRWFGRPAPNLLFMVFVFGLIHGFGLSTRLQQMTLAKDPELVTKIIAFNIGVEFGQIAALVLMTAVVKSLAHEHCVPGDHACYQRRFDRGERRAAGSASTRLRHVLAGGGRSV